MSSFSRFTLSRDCQVIRIPDGVGYTLHAGTTGGITQSRGGWHTVATDTGLFRVEGRDADALGLEPSEIEPFPAEAVGEDFDVVKAVWKQLESVYDPELPVSVVELGLVYDCSVEPLGDGRHRVDLKLGLTSPGCGMADVMLDDARDRIFVIPTVAEANVELAFDPPWDRGMMSEAAMLELGMY